MVEFVSGCILEPQYISPLWKNYKKMIASAAKVVRAPNNADNFCVPVSSLLGLVKAEEEYFMMIAMQYTDCDIADLCLIKKDPEGLPQLISGLLQIPLSISLQPVLQVKPVFTRLVEARVNQVGNRVAAMKAKCCIKPDGGINWENITYSFTFAKPGPC